MSEQKRVPTQTLELSGSLVNAGKKEKKGEKSKQLAPSFRFELSLDDKNEKGYSEFTYAHLLKAAEKKRGKEQKNHDENAANGLDPFDDDDDEKLKEMAKRFEAKYGTTTTDKNRKKYDDDVDLGAGYDENDSFIDNTDAYDEVVPEGVMTAYGGFYINSGPLEFSVKPEEQNSLAHRNNNNNDDNSSESSEDGVEDSNSPELKRQGRLLISSSEDEDVDEIVLEPLVKKVKLDENGEKKSNDEVVMKKKKKISGDQQNLDNSSSQKNNDDKRENNMEIDGNTLDCQDDRKKLNCDGARMKSKKVDVRKIAKDITVNGNDDKKIIDSKKLVGKDSNIDDAIESVVNDGRIDDESSRDTVDSNKSRCVAGTSSECEDADKMDIRLPENLPDNIRDIINKLKKAAERNKEGKIKFFDASVNSTLFSLEKKLRILDSSAVRSQVYAHLAHFLSCSKATLANRAKKLCLQDTEGRIKGPIQRLKAIIDELMPSVLEKYNNECQRIIEEKGVEASLSDIDSSDGNEKPTEKSKIPRKRFPWTSEARRLVCEIGTEWRQYFKIRKPRKESMETFVQSFMENKILPLWPQGWMRVEILLKYANPEPIAKKKQKKTRETAITNNNPLTAMSNCSVRLEISNINNVISQERVKSDTNYVKAVVENPISYSSASQCLKNSSDVTVERKQMSIKHKDKIRDNAVASQDDNNQSATASVAKISLVPTSQLMAQKPTKSHTDKFNPMDLTSGSLLITPVNDYQKTNKCMDEVKKDVVSITPYSESSISINSDAINVTNRSHVVSSSGATFIPVSMKQRPLQDSVDSKATDSRRLDDRDCDSHTIEMKEKKRDRWPDDKYKCHDMKKRRKEHKIMEQQSQQQILTTKSVDVPSTIIQAQSTILTREEQEQRQIEETMAATNFLSQMINDDTARLAASDKRKESSMMIDDNIGNIVQPSEQEKDVQMVMRSLKELQELQEMKYSPSHSPLPKPKSTHQYVQSVGYDDYHRHYHKKDEKLRLTKDEPQW